MLARANERLDDRTMNLYIYQIPLGCVFSSRKFDVCSALGGRELCNRESFSFAKRTRDFLKGDTCHSRRVKLPSEHYYRDEGREGGAGTESRNINE